MTSEPKDQSVEKVVDAIFKGQPVDDAITALVNLTREISSKPFGAVAQALFQTPPMIRDRWFRDETLRIDGYHVRAVQV